MNSPVPPPFGASNPAGQRTEPLATASLICGILSWVCLGPFAGIPAIICGHMARGRIARSAGTLGGAGLAIAGLILGYISLLATIAIVIIMVTVGAAGLPFMKQSMSTGMTTVNGMQIAQAVSAYQTQYGHLPLVAAGSTEDQRIDSKVLVEVLQGRDEAANPQKTVLLPTLPSLTTNPPGFDGWNQPFNVAVDANGNGEVRIGNLHVPGAVAVWSSGPNGVDESGAGDDLPSWR